MTMVNVAEFILTINESMNAQTYLMKEINIIKAFWGRHLKTTFAEFPGGMPANCWDYLIGFSEQALALNRQFHAAGIDEYHSYL